MRILHVTDAYLPRLGGIELHVHDLAARQRAAGDDVEILTLTNSRGTTGLPPTVRVHRPATTRLADKTAFGWHARHHAREHGFDVIHAHCSTISPLSFLTLGRHGDVPAVITVHSLWRRYTPLYRFFDVTLGWSKWSVVWSAVSNAAADSVSNAAVRPFNVPVVPNGIDIDGWTNPRRAGSANELRIVSVMRLARRKRPLPMLRMLIALRRAVPPEIKLSATIIGAGPQQQLIERYVDKHGLSEWVDLPGHLPRSAIAEALAAADVYVAPATLESFGIAALEARAAGLPVVGRRGTGLADFILSERDGLLVDDDRSMVAALTHLAINPGARQAHHEPVDLQAMSWPSVVARTAELYVAAGVPVRVGTSVGTVTPERVIDLTESSKEFSA
jgi:glycosyltransferase involved in cell wall biosynthesis